MIGVEINEIDNWTPPPLSREEEKKEEEEQSELPQEKKKKDIDKKKLINKTFKCSICNADFKTKKEMTTHIITIHKNKKIHECKICNREFNSDSALNRHARTHYEKKRESQRIKDKKEKQDEQQKSNKSVKIAPLKSSKRKIENNSDDNQLKKRRNVEKKEENHLLKCKICNQVFDGLQKLRKHEMMEHRTTSSHQKRSFENAFPNNTYIPPSKYSKEEF